MEEEYQMAYITLHDPGVAPVEMSEDNVKLLAVGLLTGQSVSNSDKR